MTIIRADKQAVHEKEGGDQGVKEMEERREGEGEKKSNLIFWSSIHMKATRFGGRSLSMNDI